MTPQLFNLIRLIGPSLIALGTTGIVNNQISNLSSEVITSISQKENSGIKPLDRVAGHMIGSIIGTVAALPIKVTWGLVSGATKGALGPVVGPLVQKFNGKAIENTTPPLTSYSVKELVNSGQHNILFAIEGTVESGLTITTGPDFGIFLAYYVCRAGLYLLIFIIIKKVCKKVLTGLMVTQSILKEYVQLKAEKQQKDLKDTTNILDNKTYDKKVIDI